MNALETKSKTTYLSPEVIDYYANYGTLQAPEEAIFKILKPKLSEARMLDIGVGGGRTTVFFAPEVKSYTAIDYSEGMIERCKQRFSERFPEANFFVGDATNLDEYQDGSLDFVLFSFNGIDYMTMPARKEFLRKARRMLAPGGQFCFSTHNIAWLKKMTVAAVIHFRLNMFAVLSKVLRRIKIRRINAAQFAAADKSDFVYINDGSHGFGLEQYFIRASHQLELLREAGFKNIRGFSLETGKEFASEKDLCASEDSWMYFLCS